MKKIEYWLVISLRKKQELLRVKRINSQMLLAQASGFAFELLNHRDKSGMIGDVKGNTRICRALLSVGKAMNLSISPIEPPFVEFDKLYLEIERTHSCQNTGARI